MSNIKFGTDGWRAIVGKDFIPENTARVIQAFADIYPNLPEAGKPVIIGFDRRKMSEETARQTAEILAGNGIKVFLSSAFCPTPCVSWNVKTKRAAAGIMITASHNPAIWNGIKFKESYGGAASPEYTNPIEEQIRKNDKRARKPQMKAVPNNLCTEFDPRTGYIDALRKFADLNIIKESKFKILIEPMYGSGSNYFPELLDTDVAQIHTEADTNFGGIQPEPIIANLGEAISIMKSGEFDICLVNDGDADRIGAIDENGNYVTSHQIFSLILKHVVETKKWKGRVIKSLTTTRMINNLCKLYGLELTTTPVGFKHISPMMNEPGVLIGGEESGGIGMPRHVCERDGLLCGLLLLELMAVRGKRIGELVIELQKEVGPYYYRRDDLHLTDEIIRKAKERLNTTEVDKLDGMKVTNFSRMDGYHYLREDDSWLLIRTSGTEPLLRTYAEARTSEDVDKLLATAKNMIGI